jgi:hypothetical protein
MSGTIGHCRKEHAPAKCRSPWGHRVELRLEGSVAVPLDDSYVLLAYIRMCHGDIDPRTRRKISITVGWYDQRQVA